MPEPTQQGASLEVCFSPALFPYIQTKGEYTVVVVDILRATTSFCAALHYGVERIIPVAGLDQARQYKAEGYPVAVEREGRILDFADYGNSAYNFMTPEARGKTIAYSTTNGTQAIAMAGTAHRLYIGAFTNLGVLTERLLQEEQNTVILCAGWKNKFNLEDSFFAGALCTRLLEQGHFHTDCDSALAALDLWQLGGTDPQGYCEKAQHRERLRMLAVDDVIPYTYQLDACPVLPALVNGALIDILK
ncbi:MAG TPA: 2-phosphosulfolactate phosphatase [Bacteroidales bacterium]|nr:2-phosphosulfolactate phosphatase [Bacteroidales bacterium]HRZ77624.1 2-phosphosulfolactate phosphatase [Bacteroidales bacterium]